MNSKPDVIAIPIQCVTGREDEIVFIVEEGSPTKVKMVQVKTGISDDKYIEVLEGLQPDQVIVKGPYKAISKELEEGTIIKVDNEIKKKTDKEE